MDIAMLHEMHAALEAAAHEAMLKVLVLRAENTLRVFSAGVDVADHTAEEVPTPVPSAGEILVKVAECVV
jgi:enoyl-CoA hydratase/carnithine racemase